MDSEARGDTVIGECTNEQDVRKEEKQLAKGRSTGQMSNLIEPKSSLSKGWKSSLARDRSAKPSEFSFPYSKDLKGTEAKVASSTVASAERQVDLVTTWRSRRKGIVQSTGIFTKTPDETSKTCSDIRATRLPEKALSWKDKLSSCLSLPLARRLTLNEWSVIRSSLGKPRRFSENFLREERRKLEQYRESVRRHYAELRTGVREEGLPADLARPLCVGQRVIAIHPKTREVHDGSVLIVDHEKCMILFDRADIGVEFVMDIDCMPFNPLDNMPEVLQRNRIFIDKYPLVPKEQQMVANVNFGGPILYNYHGLHVIAQTHILFLKQAKDTNHAISESKGATAGAINSQPSVFNQPYTVAHVQAREADIRALSELTHASDKKSPANSGIPLGLLQDSQKYMPSNESECNVPEIVKNSRAQAHAMVDTASQAIASLKEGEDAFMKIREAFDRYSQTQHSDSRLRYPEKANRVDAISKRFKKRRFRTR